MHKIKKHLARDLGDLSLGHSNVHWDTHVGEANCTAARLLTASFYVCSKALFVLFYLSMDVIIPRFQS